MIENRRNSLVVHDFLCFFVGFSLSFRSDSIDSVVGASILGIYQVDPIMRTPTRNAQSTTWMPWSVACSKLNTFF